MRGPLHLSLRIPVEDQSAVGSARRALSELARLHGASEEHVGRVALVTTELAQNLERHATQGELLARAVPHPEGALIELLSIDRGPGIEAPYRAIEDGFSTSGTRGEGLGAVSRNTQALDLYTRPGEGTVLSVRLWLADGSPPPRTPEVGAICRPHPAEEVSGDGWAIVPDGGGRTHILVTDGLGHGQLAADATQVALEVFTAHAHQSPALLFDALHRELRATRGAAVGLCTLDPARGVLTFTGVGNIVGTVWPGSQPGRSRGLASYNGTVGYLIPRVQTLEYPWEDRSLLVLHSDGLTTRWSLDAYPGLELRDPAVIAGVLYRDHLRGRDDVTVIAVKTGGDA